MNYIKLMRPKHYIKNLLIFLPLIFSNNLFNANSLIQVIIGFIAFSLMASTVYIMNDIKDREKDRNHSTKKNRPIASGAVSVKAAIIEAIILAIISISLIFIFNLPTSALVLMLVYFVINVGYSFGLKNIILVDVFIITIGFVLRVFYGASIINVEISNWLYLTIFAISFFMALGKRRNEIIKNGSKARKVLQEYNKDFLDKNMYMFLGMAIVFYSLWTTDSHIVAETNNMLIWSIPLVVLLCMRYSMDIEQNNFGDPVEVILKDKVLLTLGVLLAIFLFLVMYVL